MKHPIHPLLVHFPVACWTLATLGDLASLRFGETVWQLSGALMAVGLAMAVLAVLAGLFELRRLTGNETAQKLAFIHASLMATAFMLYLVSLLMRLEEGALTAPGGMEISFAVLGMVTLVAGGWFGGELVYGQGIGVDAAQKPD